MKEEYTEGTDFCRCQTGLSSSALCWRRTDVSLPRGFFWWAWTSLLEDTSIKVGEE